MQTKTKLDQAEEIGTPRKGYCLLLLQEPHGDNILLLEMLARCHRKSEGLLTGWKAEESTYKRFIPMKTLHFHTTQSFVGGFLFFSY